MRLKNFLFIGRWEMGRIWIRKSSTVYISVKSRYGSEDPDPCHKKSCESGTLLLSPLLCEKDIWSPFAFILPFHFHAPLCFLNLSFLSRYLPFSLSLVNILPVMAIDHCSSPLSSICIHSWHMDSLHLHPNRYLIVSKYFHLILVNEIYITYRYVMSSIHSKFCSLLKLYLQLTFIILGYI
jgi:hypothetical protein